MRIVSAGTCRSITCAAISACLFVGCSSQPESTDSTPPPAEPAAPIGTAATTGHGVVTGKVPTVSGFAPSLVILAPADARELPPPDVKPVMDQMQLMFIPAVLFVRSGQPTEFRNSDPELHNIRVREEATKGGAFNVAIPTGETYEHTFERDGFYDVGCDIHPGMTATIIATSTPFTAVADSDGNFTLYDVPPGAYIATIHAGGREIERPVDVNEGRTEVDFTETPPAPES
jgi:plastocyanin